MPGLNVLIFPWRGATANYWENGERSKIKRHSLKGRETCVWQTGCGQSIWWSSIHRGSICHTFAWALQVCMSCAWMLAWFLRSCLPWRNSIDLNNLMMSSPLQIFKLASIYKLRTASVNSRMLFPTAQLSVSHEGRCFAFSFRNLCYGTDSCGWFVKYPGSELILHHQSQGCVTQQEEGLPPANWSGIVPNR